MSATVALAKARAETGARPTRLPGAHRSLGASDPDGAPSSMRLDESAERTATTRERRGRRSSVSRAAAAP